MKAVPLDDGSGFFDLETAEVFEAGAGMQNEGIVYRTDKQHFVQYYGGKNLPMKDVDAFFWLLRNGHQEAAQKHLPVLWSQKQT